MDGSASFTGVERWPDAPTAKSADAAAWFHLDIATGRTVFILLPERVRDRAVDGDVIRFVIFPRQAANCASSPR
jgi:hypothetical protein